MYYVQRAYVRKPVAAKDGNRSGFEAESRPHGRPTYDHLQ